MAASSAGARPLGPVDRDVVGAQRDPAVQDVGVQGGPDQAGDPGPDAGHVAAGHAAAGHVAAGHAVAGPEGSRHRLPQLGPDGPGLLGGEQALGLGGQLVEGADDPPHLVVPGDRGPGRVVARGQPQQRLPDVLQRRQQLTLMHPGEQHGHRQERHRQAAEQQLGLAGVPAVGGGHAALLGPDGRVDPRVGGAHDVEHLPATGGASVVGAGHPGVDDGDRVRVEPVHRRLTLRRQLRPDVRVGGQVGQVGQLVEGDECAHPARVVRRQEGLVPGQLEAAYAGLGVGHVLQDRAVGREGLLDPVRVDLLALLHPVADQQLHQDQGGEQHHQGGETGAHPAPDRPHVRPPAA